MSPPRTLRRKILRGAATVSPLLTAAVLAQRYLSSDHAIIDELASRRHRFQVRSIGEGAYLIRPTIPETPDDAPRLLVVPGHNGHFRQFARLNRALQKRGARVDFLVMPGHAHAQRTVCSMRHMVDAIIAASSREGPYRGLVAHCVSANATLFALNRGLQCPRICLVSTPLDLPALLRFGGRQYGLKGKCLDRFETRVSLLNAPFALDTPWQSIAAARQEDLLAVHAVDDWAAPIQGMRPFVGHWPGARLAEFEKGGHNGILNLRPAVACVADFLVPT